MLNRLWITIWIFIHSAVFQFEFGVDYLSFMFAVSWNVDLWFCVVKWWRWWGRGLASPFSHAERIPLRKLLFSMGRNVAWLY